MKAGALALVVVGCASSSQGQIDAPPGTGSDSGCECDAPNPDASFPATLDGNRDRLLQTYFARLKTIPDTAQSNGLLGRNLASVCALWTGLDPSAQGVFLTLTHRLQGSVLADASHALDHVTRLYRVIGGQGATSTSAGSCGGGEYNRMIMSTDPALHTAQIAANSRHGATPYDLADIPLTSFWRDSHDAAGPHAPFNLSDETNAGAPRGQTQYFRDPAATVATTALGRVDVEAVVDPYALEMDQDYDCVHNSNPSCDYVFYGAACAPQTSQSGIAIYTQNYGAIEPAWKPTGC